MDVQSWLLSGPGLGAAAVVLVALLSALVFLRTDLLRGKSYEEAVAEQRRAANELLKLATGKPKFTTVKKNKKFGKKAKEKRTKEVIVTASEEGESDTLESQGEEPATSKGHVEFAEETTMEQLAEDHKDVRKRGKSNKIKPILVNKEDPSCVSDPSAPSSPSDSHNHFEEIHPKDELELMLSSLDPGKAPKKEELVVEKKEGKAGKGKAQIHSKNAKTVEPSKEEIPKESPKEQRKGKKFEKKTVVDVVIEGHAEEETAPAVIHPEELLTEKLLKRSTSTVTPAVEKISAPQQKLIKKNKKPKPSILSILSSNVEGLNVNDLASLLSDAVLSRSEIQILTDCLLNKQHGPLPQHTEWSGGPNDAMAKLKKQLADKEKALLDEQEATQAVHAKVKELRAQLNGDRARATAALRAQETAEASLKSRQHEVTLLQQRVSTLAEDLHQLTQLNHQLQTQMKTESEAAAQRGQLEIAIQRLSESESALRAELAARDQMLNTQQHQHSAQLQEAQRLFAEADSQRGAGARAAHELLQANERIQELQSELGRVSAQFKEEAEKQNQLYLNQINQMKSETETKNTEKEQKYKSEIDALKSDSEIIKKQYEQVKSELEQSKSELKQRKSEFEQSKSELEQSKSELEKCRSELEQSKSELKKSKSDLEQLKTDKEQLKLEKEQMSSEKDEFKSGQESASEELKCRLEEVQLENKKLKVELEESRATVTKISQQKHNGVAHDSEKKVEAVKLLRSELEEAQAGNLLHRQQLANLTTQLQTYKDKNNELRTKNWKVMDALQAAERHNQRPTLHEEVSKACEEQYLEIRRVLERGCPQAAVADSNASRDRWLPAFVERLSTLSSPTPAPLPTPATVSENSSEQLQELENQNEQLKALVDNYKQIISDTEGVLSRLQQNVSAEEQRWAKQLEDKQNELDSLKQHSITQMQSKIDFLQSSLERERKGAHTSLADVERGIIEENARLKHISGNLLSGSHNGPEVGLGEK